MSDTKQTSTEGLFYDFISYVWSKKRYVSIRLGLVSIAAVIFSLYLPNIYISSAKLTPMQDDGISSSSIASVFGQLPGLGGINVNSGSASTREIAVISLKSYKFFETLYPNDKFLSNLIAVDGFNDEGTTFDKDLYDPVTSKWTDKKPHPQDAYDKYLKALNITEDAFKPVLSISFISLSPNAAQEMTSFVLREIDTYIKIQDIEQSKKAISYLRNEVAKSVMPDVRETLSRMITQYMGKLVTSEKSDQYVFNIIDAPYVPIEKYKPSRAIICITVFIIALFIDLSYLFVLFLFNLSLIFSFKKGFTLIKNG